MCGTEYASGGLLPFVSVIRAGIKGNLKTPSPSWRGNQEQDSSGVKHGVCRTGLGESR